MNRFISIVIPTCNRPDTLKRCVQSVLGTQDFDKLVSEIIISDDSTNDDTKVMCKEFFSNYNILYVRPTRGPAANRNNGAKISKAEWLLFLDDDIIVHQQLLVAYQQALSKHCMADAFEGAIFPDDEKLLNKEFAECPVNTIGNLFWSANILIRNSTFQQLSGFDETFFRAAHEDQDIYQRLINANCKVFFVKDAYVIHPVRIVGFCNKVLAIPDEQLNWKYFFNKYRKGGFIRSTLITHFDCAYRSILKFHFRKALYHFLVIVYVPILIIK